MHMKIVIFICGIVIGAVGALAAYRDVRRPEAADNIIFAAKSFYDSKRFGDDFGLVSISGTLTGKDLAYPNNTYSVSCHRDYKACFVATIEQIGHDQIGRMQSPVLYPIVKWNDYEIVAQDEVSTLTCSRVTFTINRSSEELLWVEEPTNQTKSSCKFADTNIRKYIIEDSPGWKRLFGKKD
jgi:hypothetical protein